MGTPWDLVKRGWRGSSEGLIKTQLSISNKKYFYLSKRKISTNNITCNFKEKRHVYRFAFFLLLHHMQTGLCVPPSEHQNIMAIFVTREFGTKN